MLLHMSSKGAHIFIYRVPAFEVNRRRREYRDAKCLVIDYSSLVLFDLLRRVMDRAIILADFFILLPVQIGCQPFVAYLL